jgi:hypothetical protein
MTVKIRAENFAGIASMADDNWRCCFKLYFYGSTSRNTIECTAGYFPSDAIRRRTATSRD